MKQRLPLMVLYEHGESWFVEDDKPVAIYLLPDVMAAYVCNLPKLPWGEAKQRCQEMTEQNLYWSVPNAKQLLKLLELREVFDRTAVLIGAETLRRSRYWSKTKIVGDKRFGVNFAWRKEVEIDYYQYSFVRPFLVL